jgi:hypothetical protein
VIFLVDDAAKPVVTDRVMAPLPLQYFPLGNESRLLTYVEQLKRAEEQACREIYDSGIERS